MACVASEDMVKIYPFFNLQMIELLRVSKDEKLLAEIYKRGVSIVGAGAFGTAILKVLQTKSFDNFSPELQIYIKNLCVVSERSENEVLQMLYEKCKKPTHSSTKIHDDYWYADRKKSRFFEKLNDNGEIIHDLLPRFTIEKPDELTIIAEQTKERIKHLGIHILCCNSKQAFNYKQLLNNSALRPIILLDGTKGYTENIEFTNRNVEYATMSGPNYAQEIYDDTPTGIHIATKLKEIRKQLEILFEANPSFVVETSNNPEYIKAIGDYKNLMTFAYGIAINCIKNPKKRTDFYYKLLEGFKNYADSVGVQPHTLFDDFKKRGVAFFGDTWMCTVHGSSDLPGKKSRNFTVAQDVGNKSMFQGFQNQSNQENNFSPEDFVSYVRQKQEVSTLEGYNTYKALKAKGVKLPVLDFIENALNGKGLSKHEFLRTKNRKRVKETIEKEDWFKDYKKLCFYIKSMVVSADYTANSIALVMTRVAQEIIATVPGDRRAVKEHMLKVLIDVSQEQVNVKKFQDVSIENLKPFAKGEILRYLVKNFDKKEDKFQAVLDVILNSKKNAKTEKLENSIIGKARFGKARYFLGSNVSEEDIANYKYKLSASDVNYLLKLKNRKVGDLGLEAEVLYSEVVKIKIAEAFEKAQSEKDFVLTEHDKTYLAHFWKQHIENHGLNVDLCYDDFTQVYYPIDSTATDGELHEYQKYVENFNEIVESKEFIAWSDSIFDKIQTSENIVVFCNHTTVASLPMAEALLDAAFKNKYHTKENVISLNSHIVLGPSLLTCTQERRHATGMANCHKVHPATKRGTVPDLEKDQKAMYKPYLQSIKNIGSNETSNNGLGHIIFVAVSGTQDKYTGDKNILKNPQFAETFMKSFMSQSNVGAATIIGVNDFACYGKRQKQKGEIFVQPGEVVSLPDNKKEKKNAVKKITEKFMEDLPKLVIDKNGHSIGEWEEI